jgi:hypothetical protein
MLLPMLPKHSLKHFTEKTWKKKIKFQTISKQQGPRMCTVFFWFDLWSRRQKPKLATKMKTALSWWTNAKLNRTVGLGDQGFQNARAICGSKTSYHVFFSEIVWLWWHSLNILEFKVLFWASSMELLCIFDSIHILQGCMETVTILV